jgi:phosphate transport system protein
MTESRFDDHSKLHASILEMMELVLLQIEKTKKAILFMDINLAQEVFNIEKRIDILELVIDKECESLLVLHNPVAMDMRFTVSMLKINGELERMSDLSNSVAQYVTQIAPKSYHEMIMNLYLPKMFDTVLEMLRLVMQAFENKENINVILIFDMDKQLNEFNEKAQVWFSTHLENDPIDIKNKLNLFIAVKRLERMGDHLKNIVENLIYYKEAKVLKHQKKVA